VVSEPPVREVPITGGDIRLGQFLKRAELVDTGAEGKELVAAGEVLVNDEVETRRGRQLEHGDVVRAAAGAVRVVAG
jgi:ribosome-associated protein